MDNLQEFIVPTGGQQPRINKSPLAYLYTIDYDEDIGEPSDYREDFLTFRAATQNDVIQLMCNSNGGSLQTLIQLINNIRACDAHIVTQIEGVAHSAASALFLAGQEYVVAPNTCMLIHESTFGVMESSAKLHAHVDFSKKHTRACFEDFYHNFLTPEEIDSVLQGHDMWLDSDEIIERLQRKAELDNQDMEEAEEGDEVVEESPVEEHLWELDYIETLEQSLTKRALQDILQDNKVPYHAKDTKSELSVIIVNNLTKDQIDKILDNIF